MRARPHALLSILFAAAAAFALFQSREWPLSARLFPMLAATPLLALSLAQLALDLRGGQRGRILDIELFKTDAGPRVAAQRTANILGWIVGFVAAIWLIGLQVSVPAMVFAYLRFQGKNGWLVSVALTAVAAAFFWGAFVEILHLPLPEPRLLAWWESLVG